MITERNSDLIKASEMTRVLAGVILLAALLSAFGCGGDSEHAGSSAKYPIGISEDIEQQLKYDARVDSFEPDGQDLVINVNDTWLHSPTGMRERTLGQWYSLWQPSHDKTSKIVVKYEGNEVESWTADKGYQPAMEKKNASEG